jgi:CheY-like chemotaxis protein
MGCFSSKESKTNELEINETDLEKGLGSVVSKIPLKKVMIVDDVNIMGEVIIEYFNISNPEVEVLYASSGEEALKIYNKNKDIQIIFMDIVMHPMDGYETTEQLKQKGCTSIIIGLTDMVDFESVTKAKSSGMLEVCRKPIQFNELKLTVEKYGYKIYNY